MRYAPLFLLLLVHDNLFAQPSGYRNVIFTDSTRRYKPAARPGDLLYYRPIEIDYWYPVDAIPSSPIRYGEFLQLFEQRANRFQDDTVYSGLAGQTAQYLCSGLGITDTARLTQYPTRSYRDAPALRGSFPLILYLSSYNGMCFENTRLFEILASHGYTVASITSVGRYPGNMTTDPADLQEQVADALFVLKKLEAEKTGVIGYSWGGPGALLLAGAHPVGAVLSLDGSEFHYYGEPDADDSNFNRVRALLPSTPSAFAYAYLESDNKQSDGPADSIFNPLPKKYLRFASATHEDFSCLPWIAAGINKKDSAGLPDYPGFAVKWFDHYLKNATPTFPPNSSYPVVAAREGRIVTARLFDGDDKTPLAYVNVGVPDKNIGTVTDSAGVFSLMIPAQLSGDSVAISIAGYQKRILPFKKIHDTIFLARHAMALAEAVVASSVPRHKVLGNKTKSNKISVGFPMRFLGAEIGVKMSIGKTARRLQQFHCHLTGTRVNSATFRLNIYRLRENWPENILQQNILLEIGNSPGDYCVDLSHMNLVLSGDILVSLELLRSYSAIPNSGAVYFSAAFFNSGTWRRPTSQAAWKKVRGIGVGFNLEVR